MSKKAQLTIFMILGIIILIFAMLFIFLNSDINKKEAQFIPLDFQPVKSFIDSCLKNTATEGIYYISLQGGYYRGPELSRDYYDISIPYYWYMGDSKMPEINSIEIQLSEYIKSELPNCLNDFKNFKDLGYSFELRDISLNSSFIGEHTEIEMHYPISIKKGTEMLSIASFRQEIDFNFKEKYEIVKNIIEEQKKTPNSMPFSFIMHTAFSNNLTYETITLDSNTILYALIFKEHLRNEDYIYAFLSKYNWSGISNVSILVKIEPIPEFEIKEPILFNYKVNAIGTNISYYDNTELFDIDTKTGWINCYISASLNGIHNIFIRAIDLDGNEDYAVMKINISIPSQVPVIDKIGNFSALLGEEFVFKVNATDPTGEFMTLLDDTSLFDINPITAEINFIPEMPGNYTIKITAVNKVGHSFEYMGLEIK